MKYVRSLSDSYSKSSSRSRGRGTARIWNRVLDTEAVDGWVLDTAVEDCSRYLGHKNIYFKKSQTITAESKTGASKYD